MPERAVNTDRDERISKAGAPARSAARVRVSLRKGPGASASGPFFFSPRPYFVVVRSIAFSNRFVPFRIQITIPPRVTP